MSLVPFLRMYLLAHVLIALAALVLFIVGKVSAHRRRPMSYRQQLHLGYVLLFVALVAPAIAMRSDGADFLPLSTQVWSATSMDALDTASMQGSATISTGASQTGVSLVLLSQYLLALLFAGLVVAIARILAAHRAVARILQRGHLIRRSGTLRIVATDEALVPFSCWLPGACHIVVPTTLIARPADFHIALRHEGQHHRHGDTRMVFAMELLWGVFFLNPAMHALLRQLRGLQEFACDEAMIRRHRVPVRAYCACLVAVAEDATLAPCLPACLSMAGAAGPSLLARRVLALLEGPRQHLQRSRVLAVYAATALAVLGAGVVLSASIDDRRVSLSEAQEMAAVAESQGGIPLPVNDQVLAELNRLVGTPDGRAFTRAALTRMQAHAPMISAQLRQHALPSALLAVPLVESGYRNIAQGPNPRHGAGIWMFVKPAAKRFGLDVEQGRDQRLDVAAETAAAMKMFSSLHAEFSNWGFVLLAYNGGSALVRRAISEKGVTDALTATRLGYQNDPNYVPRVMAAIIVLNNTRRLGLQD